MMIFLQCVMAISGIVAVFVMGNANAGMVILCICTIGILAASIIGHIIQEKRISELIAYLMKVQDNLSLPALSKCSEGQLGILQSEIYKVVALLNEQSNYTSKQNKYMADMLSDISHQIKTPLAAITIMTDLLDSGGLTEEKRAEYIGNIEGQVKRITWLIRNLLTLSQLEAEVLKLKRQMVTAKALLENACEPFLVMAELKGVALHIKAEDEMQFECDIHWTTEAISNIVKNCIEHTDCGGEVHASASQNNFALSITISDNGAGIAKENLPHIFDRFYKADNTASDSVGIGLAMSKQIIMRQNGTITAESEEGKGTRFLVRFYV
ncbi:MAG: HAMP domain-containing histidine kinase [Clostridium sp.]|nr:HAMP domain-containing histidine kinase [Clostridium sp.]